MSTDLAGLGAAIDALAAETGFGGTVRVDDGDDVVHLRAYGLADRAHGIAHTVDTRVAVASGCKTFTALAVVGLVADGTLAMATTARSILGADLPLIADDVTVEHLLAHRSGIGDYLDEDEDGDLADHVLPVPVHELADAEQYLAVLGGFPTKFAADERFSYCNSGYAVLAILAERASGVPFHELVQRRVLDPAGLTATAYLRSDELPGDAAIGYLDDEGLRTNVLHLPVRGGGDGGVFTTAADVHAFWSAFVGGRIVGEPWVATMVAPRSDAATPGVRYGLGVWVPRPGWLMLEGCDAGASFRSLHDPVARRTASVLSNSTDGAWPIAELLGERLGSGPG